MKKNKLIIAGAGSGKTTFLINDAMLSLEAKVLITTYTEANEAEIKQKIISKYKCIPKHITVQTWFSFLIQHGIRPYQGTFNEQMFESKVRGLDLVSNKSAKRYDKHGRQITFDGNPLYWGESEYRKHYFNSKWKVYSDKLAKLVFHSNAKSDNEVISRISRIFPNIYIDEVQDLAGYDLELIKLFFKSSSKVTLVGDPRQVTYLTHNETKHKIYSDGKIKQFLLDKCKSLINGNIDEASLSVSHRNNKEICNYSSKLYPDLPVTAPCTCLDCRSCTDFHQGIYLINDTDRDTYLNTYKPTQLRWNSLSPVNPDFFALNFGESKGTTFERVIVYPTKEMKEWILDNSYSLKPSTRAKFYVGITRAKYSVGIVMTLNAGEKVEGLNHYTILPTKI